MPGTALQEQTLRTLLVVETLASGRLLAYPLVAPEHVAVGEEEDVLVGMGLFLAELLPTEPPHVVARYALPELAEASGGVQSLLRTFELHLVDRSLPEPLRREAPFLTHGVVVPHHDGRWVLLPALRQTVYIGPSEDLQPTVRAEVQARLDAFEAPLRDQLAWLPAPTVELRWIEIDLGKPTGRPDGARDIARRLADAQRRRYARRVLDEVGRDRVSPPGMSLAPVVGRTSLIADLGALLGSSDRLSVLLVGEPGVGKSAVLEGWLAASHDEPDAPLVIQTSGAQLIAGMSGQGQWQARLERVIEACETLDAILYFDDLSDLFDARGEARVDLSAPLARALDEGRLRIVAEITPALLGELGSRREAFFRNLQNLRVEPTTGAVGRQALLARRNRLVDTLEVTDDAIDAMMSIGERFLPYRPHPGKVTDLFDSVVRAARDPMGELPRVTGRDVHRLFGAQSGVPEVLLREDRSLDADALRTHFNRHVIGQTAAVDAVVDTLCVAKAGLQAADKPLATFLFAGPTGVGKTELARALARYLYGSAERLLRFDMSEFADAWAAERLIRGTRGEEGELTRRIRQQPFAVVLLDEIEKAHSTLFDLLLQVTGEGRLTDARGRTAYFHDAIIVMTSNIGATEHRRPIGPRSTDASEELGQHYEGAVRRLFRPELVGRIDRIIPFASLDDQRVRAIADLQVARIRSRRGLRSRGLALEVDPRALDRMVEEGHDPRYGARALRRELEDRIVVGVSERIALAPSEVQRGVIRVAPADALTAAEGSLVRDGFATHFAGDAKNARADRSTLQELQTLRREVDENLDLPVPVGARERAAFLIAEMTLTVSRADGDGSDIGALQREHHGLRGKLAALDALREETVALEEMLFVSALDGERLPVVADEVDELRHRSRMALLDLYLEVDPRHEIALLCQEWDDGRTLDWWLAPLLASLDRRRWSAACHVFKDPGPSEGWPSARAFGPPRGVAWMLDWLERPDRERVTCVVRLRGPDVGTLVGLETGLHRFLGVPTAGAVSHHIVRPLAMRFTLLENEWDHPAMHPAAPPSARDAARMQVCRYTDERPNRTLPPGYVDVPVDQYWSETNSDELALRTLIGLDRRGGDPSQLFRGELDRPETNAGGDGAEAEAGGS